MIYSLQLLITDYQSHMNESLFAIYVNEMSYSKF